MSRYLFYRRQIPRVFITHDLVIRILSVEIVEMFHGATCVLLCFKNVDEVESEISVKKTNVIRTRLTMIPTLLYPASCKYKLHSKKKNGITSSRLPLTLPEILSFCKAFFCYICCFPEKLSYTDLPLRLACKKRSGFENFKYVFGHMIYRYLVRTFSIPKL